MAAGSQTKTVSKMEEIEQDPRFAHIPTDPRFKPNIKRKKVKIDSRFKSMLQDKEFSVKFKDKRGRPTYACTTPKEDLRRLYVFDDESPEDKGLNKDSDKELVEAHEADTDDSESEADTDDSESEAENGFPDQTPEGGIDRARGIGLEDFSDDDDGDEAVAEEAEEEQGMLDHNWNQPDHDAPEAEGITSRLALCNMDWDRIKAKDLYLLCNSFTPQGGTIRSVTIYPSKLGSERMAEEEQLGPREFREGEERKASRPKGSMCKLDRAKLRRYQLNRLAYYYAVIVCDSAETASKIYSECDGMEYEKSSCCVDLRFIPEGMTFEESPKDSCTGITDLSNFQPSIFTTTAFCQAKVQVTWDETNIERLKKTMKKKFMAEDLDSNQFDDLIASASSEEETSGDEASMKKNKGRSDIEDYRRLLGLDKDSPSSVEEESEDEAVEEEESEEEEQEMQIISCEEEEEEQQNVMSGKIKEKDKKKKQETELPLWVREELEQDEEEVLNTMSGKTKGKDKKKKKKQEKQVPSCEEEEEQELSILRGKTKEEDKKKKKKKQQTELPPWVREELEQEEEQPCDRKSTETKKEKKKKAKSRELNMDASEDEAALGEMQYTWQAGTKHGRLDIQARKKLTPWEEYKQKKKEKKKQKKLKRKQKEQGPEDTTDLGFDDPFFNDDPGNVEKKKKDRKKKKRQSVAEEVEESEADRKERASLALMMQEDQGDHTRPNLLQIMREESLGQSPKGKKRKRAEAQAEDFEVALDLSRFGRLVTDPDMHIDPNAPQFKKTKGMLALMEEVSRKRKTAPNAL